ncbi:MAG: PKD domain-containing protein [Patescibacteria group bacterium]
MFFNINLFAQTVPVADGFQFPLENYTVNDGCLEWGGTNDYFPGTRHVADDECSSETTDVFATTRGLVRYARFHRACDDPNNPGGWGYIIIIESQTNSGNVCVIYGHVKPTVNEGMIVESGTLIGKIDAGGSCWADHIHFSIYKGMYGTTNGVYPSWLMGYMDINLWPGNYVDPIWYVNNNPPSSSPVGCFSTNDCSGPVSLAFQQKYNAMAAAGHPLGDPWDNGGSVYVHEVNGMYIQDFQDPRDQGGPSNGYYHPYTALIYDATTVSTANVRLLKEGFWDTWMNNTGWVNFGSPITDEYSNGGETWQTFRRYGLNYSSNQSDYENFYFTWNSNTQLLEVLDKNYNPVDLSQLTVTTADVFTRVFKSASLNDSTLNEYKQYNRLDYSLSDSLGGGSRLVSDTKISIAKVMSTTTEPDGVYHSGLAVSNLGQPFPLVNQRDYENFYAVINGKVILIDPFTMNGDMTIYVDDSPPEADIQFSHWTIYPNPGTVGQQIHVEGQIYNQGSSAVTLSEVRVEFLAPNGAEIYHWSEYNVTLDPGYYWYQWLYCYPYISGNHTARFRGFINGQWQTYATQTVYVQNDPNDPVSADFSASPTFGISPLVVQFIDQSLGGPTSYEWDFGDGTFSSDSNPLKVYNDSGFYTVSLTVSDEQSSDTLVKVNYISLYDSIDSCIIGLYGLPGRGFGIDVVGNYAYIASYDAGLQIIDVSNPTSPVIVGSVDTPGLAWAIDIVGNYAYIADCGAGFHVIDINNPTSPVIVGSVDTPGSAKGVVVSGNHAYVGDETYGLQIIDVSNPTSPVIVAHVNTPTYVIGVFVSGNYAYITDAYNGLQIIDVSNPTSPVIVGSVDTPNYAIDVVVSDNYAYVADISSGLQIIDVSNPTSPTIVGSVDTPNRAYEVILMNNLVLLADRYSGLQIIDVSNPTSPTIVGSVDTPHDAMDLGVFGDYVCVADNNAGLVVISFDCALYLKAGFVSDVISGSVPLTVQFTDQSVGNFTSWFWDFGDGTTSTQQNPKHTYIGGGNCNVSLTVSDGNITNTKTIENFITVRIKNFKDDPKIELAENYPNPFNPSTTISYSLPTSQHVSLVVYNILGQTVTTLVDGMKEAGEHSVIWDGRNDHGSPVSSGMYFYRLTTTENSIVRKMILLK